MGNSDGLVDAGCVSGMCQGLVDAGGGARSLSTFVVVGGVRVEAVTLTLGLPAPRPPCHAHS